jgi:phasin family protein
MKAKNTTSKAANEGGNNPQQSKPDLRRLLEGIRLPKVNLRGLIEARGKDAEALLAVHRRAFEGYQEFNRKQAEILARAMQQLHSGARAIASGQPAPESVSRAAERAQKLYAQTLTDLYAMAEVAARANRDVIAIINQRIGEGLKAIGVPLGKAD